MHSLKYMALVAAMAMTGHAGDFIDFHLPTQPVQTAGCTLTMWELPQFNLGPTRTVYTTTTTATDAVDCGICTAVTTALFPDGPGPVAHFTTTVTEPYPTTVTDYKCATPTPTWGVSGEGPKHD
ncbi:hypothetical protein E4U54_001912 [Claviceps lovelessii]|nr:hypothetical protein E4U54_001912 [Claviceps lovelessii]